MRSECLDKPSSQLPNDDGKKKQLQGDDEKEQL